jgi:hypothetical protein
MTSMQAELELLRGEVRNDIGFRGTGGKAKQAKLVKILEAVGTSFSDLNQEVCFMMKQTGNKDGSQ